MCKKKRRLVAVDIWPSDRPAPVFYWVVMVLEAGGGEDKPKSWLYLPLAEKLFSSYTAALNAIRETEE